MAKANTEKRRTAPPSAAERAEQMAFKQRQVVVWEAKLDAAKRELQDHSNSSSSSSWGIGWGSSNNGSGGGNVEQVQSDNPAALARLKHAEARLEALRTGIAELQKQADQQADGAAQEAHADSNRGGGAAAS